jgi:subtilisin family serine protease
MSRSSYPRRSMLAAAAVALLALLAPVPTAAAPMAVDADDPAFTQGLQWGLERIGAPRAWQEATGAGTIIAIVDSGADLGHEDLVGRIETTVSCIGAAGDPGRCGRGSAQDDNGHGTHAAGIAAAHTGNGTGIAGVAPGARLMIVRVLRDQCTNPADRSTCTASGTAGDVAAGIRWAAQNGADVINLSLGGGAIQSIGGCAFCDAVRDAWDLGAIPVVAAGNDAILPAGFGVDDPAVVVTATTRDDRAASYSNTNSDLLRRAKWPVAAPGGEGERDSSDCAPGGHPRGILSTYVHPGLRNGYACLAGTSMAAPHVSGSLAVLRSQGRSPQDAVERLLATADDLGRPGRDATFGYGRINLARAVGSSPSPATSPGTVAPPPTEPATTEPPQTEPAEPPTTVAPPTTTAPAIASEDITDTTIADDPDDATTDEEQEEAAGDDAPDGDGDGEGDEPAQAAAPEHARVDDDELPPGLVVLAAAMAVAAWGAVGSAVRTSMSRGTPR